jgi:hypothetical protein
MPVYMRGDTGAVGVWHKGGMGTTVVRVRQFKGMTAVMEYGYACIKYIGGRRWHAGGVGALVQEYSGGG